SHGAQRRGCAASNGASPLRVGTSRLLCASYPGMPFKYKDILFAKASRSFQQSSRTRKGAAPAKDAWPAEGATRGTGPANRQLARPTSSTTTHRDTHDLQKYPHTPNSFS